jgi:two-component system, OmpR family, response regulator
MPTRNCRSVLYVDDDPDIRMIVRTTLCLLAGLDTQVAHSGEMGIDLAYEKRPDLIILDVMMPGLDGPSTYKRIRESPLISDIPVIFMTAKVLPSEINHFLQLGAIGVIRKPFDPLKLGDEVMALWNKAGAAHGSPGAHNGEAQVSIQVDSLAAGFLERTKGDVARLRNLTECARRGDRSVFKEIERVGHSIHGAGAMFGFPSVSAAGDAIEHWAAECMASSVALRPTDEFSALQLLQLTEQLAQNLAAAGSAMPSGGGLLQERGGVE